MKAAREMAKNPAGYDPAAWVRETAAKINARDLSKNPTLEDEARDAESARLRDLWAKLDAESGYTR